MSVWISVWQDGHFKCCGTGPTKCVRFFKEILEVRYFKHLNKFTYFNLWNLRGIVVTTTTGGGGPDIFGLKTQVKNNVTLKYIEPGLTRKNIEHYVLPKKRKKVIPGFYLRKILLCFLIINGYQFACFKFLCSTRA